jgi:hypothetical protein
MMLFQIATYQPQMLGTIVRNTPYWVWSLLTALLVLGGSQLFARRASPLRVCILPVVKAALAIYGLVSAFGNAQHGPATAIAWLTATIGSIALALWLRPAAPAGSRFDAPSQWNWHWNCGPTCCSSISGCRAWADWGPRQSWPSVGIRRRTLTRHFPAWFRDSVRPICNAGV